MKRKDIIRLSLVCLALATTFLVIGFSGHTAGDSYKKSLEQPDNERASGKIIWETLSHQFFSTL